MRLATVVLAALLLPGPANAQFSHGTSWGPDGITRRYSETPTALLQGDSISFVAVYLNATSDQQQIPLSCDFEVSGDLEIDGLGVECGISGDTAEPGDSAWIRVTGHLASPPGDYWLYMTPGRSQIAANYRVYDQTPPQSYLDLLAVPTLYLLEVVRGDDEPLAPDIVLGQITEDALEAVGFSVARGEGEGVRRLMEARPGFVVEFTMRPDERQLDIELCIRGPIPDIPETRCRSRPISTARPQLLLGSEIATAIHRLARPYWERLGQG